MIVSLATKTRFRADILSNRIGEIVHESLKGTLGKSVGAPVSPQATPSIRDLFKDPWFDRDAVFIA